MTTTDTISPPLDGVASSTSPPIHPLHVGRLPRGQYRIDGELGLRLVALWHVVGIAAAFVALVATLNPAGNEGLPGAIRFLLLGVHALAVLGHAYSAVGVRNRWRRARTISLLTNYLLLVVSASAALHQLDAFRAIGALGQGFNKGFVPFLVVLVGVIWTAVARNLRLRAPESPAPPVLHTAGRVIIAAGAVWFVIAADPIGLLERIVDGLSRPLTLGALLVAVAAGLACSFMWQPRIAAVFGTTKSQADALAGLAFLSPNILGFLFFFAGPLIFSLVVSFFDWTTTNTSREFVFLDNYIRALSLDVASTDAGNAGTEVLNNGYQVLANIDWFGQHLVIGARDVEFWLSLRNIIVFMVLAVPLSVLPALGLSSILASRLPGMKVFRAIYFVPSVAGVIGVSIIWGQLFQSTVGWINYLITRIADVLPFVDPPASGQPWLSDDSTALFSLVVVFAWMLFGFNTVLYLAGHQGISKELYEAAEIDGASTWRIFRRITVPQLRATTFYIVTVTSILALQLFDIVWVLSTPEPGGPDNATTTPVLTLYEEAFRDNNTGYASALAWVLFLMIFGLTFSQFRRQRDEAST